MLILMPLYDVPGITLWVLGTAGSKGDVTVTDRLSGVMVRVVSLVLCVQAAEAGSQGPEVGHESCGRPAQRDLHGWVVHYRLVGDPEEEVYQEFHEVGPEGREVPYPEEVILVRVERVILGNPPIDENGFFRYRSLFATIEVWPLPLGPYGPWRHLKYEFTGLRRKDPQTGQVFVKVEVRPLLGRWLASALLLAGLIVANLVFVVLVAVSLRRRLGRAPE